MIAIEARVGQATGRSAVRSSLLEHPGESSIGEDDCGPCRRRGNRSERDSHPGLDGAQDAPPTTAHKSSMGVKGKDT